MKHIMISIRPEWVEKILSGEKTLEIRKTMPKCKLPCKVYIYCSKSNKKYLNRKDGWLCFTEDRDVLGITDNVRKLTSNIDGLYERLNGLVVAEFTLNYVEEFECSSQDHRKIVFDNKSCLTLNQVLDYCNGQTLYGWHIDNLEIYDTPKELTDFGLKRPFQSWGYLKDEN